MKTPSINQLQEVSNCIQSNFKPLLNYNSYTFILQQAKMYQRITKTNEVSLELYSTENNHFGKMVFRDCKYTLLQWCEIVIAKELYLYSYEAMKSLVANF